MTLTVNGKEYEFKASMKKIVELNTKYGVTNLREKFFNALNEVDFEFLAKILLTLADGDTSHEFNRDINKVYDFMEAYVQESNSDYESLYKLLAEEINDKSFFGKKMSKKALEEIIANPIMGMDINRMVNKATEKAVNEAFNDTFASAFASTTK